MRITPATELEYRCRQVQKSMAEEDLDALLIMQNADLYYFTGSIQSGCLYIPAHGQPLYMVRRDAGRARMESGLKEIISFSSMKEIPHILASYGYITPKRIGVEMDVLPVSLFERYRSVFSDASWLDSAPLVRRIRMIKSAYEIHIMMDAAQQVDKVYQRAREVIREGMTDVELASELEFTARRQGHSGLIRMRGFNGEMCFGHTFSGTDSAVPAYTDTPFGGIGVTPAFGQGASYKPIGRNEPIIIDFAGSLDGYLVDQTRIFSIGNLPDRLKKGCDDMMEIQELMKKQVKAGAGWGEIYDACLALAVAQGYANNFMGTAGAQVSFIGHGVGIEIDEYPFIARGFGSTPLEVGMAFAFEPKVVFPGEGAVGIENTFYLSAEGLKQLTVSDEHPVVL